jgi:hydrogenase-4 component B
MSGLGSLYALKYWEQNHYRRNGRMMQIFWGGLTAGMALLVTASHAMAFLLGWEIMALSAFFLVSLENHIEETRRAGLVYLIATHVCTLSLFGMFSLWKAATGSFDMNPAAASMTPGVITVIFLVALLAFGLKAGLMPLHFWLPGAHANAPSHVSAMMSGVLLKMGVYGMLRMLTLLPSPPPLCGWSLLVLGCVSSLLGVVFALGQHDLKSLLAYHSVENIGIIFMGMGLAMTGRSSGHETMFLLGMAGCLLHVWNHSLFKSLLFLGAGSVIHATGTRAIDRLGGLAKKMPVTANLFLIGAIAICGLPPLNGFISELFIYMGIFSTVAGGGAGSAGETAVFAAPVLAMTGALAVACFVKVYGIIFLGEPRTGDCDSAHESHRIMIIPMAALALCCVFIGMAPAALSPVLDRVTASFFRAEGLPAASLNSIAPLRQVGMISLVLTLSMAGLSLFLIFFIKRRLSVTWDCGYAAPTGRMQYTASSFARMIIDIFAWITSPRDHRPEMKGLFPEKRAMMSHIDDAVMDRALIPAFRDMQKSIWWFHRFQQGLIQNYIMYIMVFVILLLMSLIPFGDIFALFYGR